MKPRLSHFLALTVSFGLWVGNMPLTAWSETGAEGNTEPTPAAIAPAASPVDSTPPSTSASPGLPLDIALPKPLLAQIEALAATPLSPPQGVQPLSLQEVLNASLLAPEIAMSEEKTRETEARRMGVERKRVLLFFKYLNASYLEGSAESDVSAARMVTRQQVNQSLVKAVRLYFQLVQTQIARHLAIQGIQQTLQQLTLNQSRFQSGKATSFEVLETENELLKRYQKSLEADAQYQGACVALRAILDNVPTASASSEESAPPLDSPALHASLLTLEAQTGTFAFPIFTPMPPQLTLQMVLDSLETHRPELQEVSYRVESMDHLRKAAIYEFNPDEIRLLDSAYQQLALKRQALRQAYHISATQQFQQYQLAQQKLALSTQRKALAETALRQTRVSFQAGFSSNKDVLDAQVQWNQAQADTLQAVLDYNMSEVALLYEMGQVGIEPILEKLGPTWAPSDS